MAFSDPRGRGFFADKNRAFWVLQGGGWFAYFLLRSLGGLANGMGVFFILPSFIVTLTGFSLTLLMAAAFRRVIRLRPALVWTITVVVLGAAAGLFSILEVWAHATFYEPGWQPVGVEFMGAILLDLAILTAWTGLYYTINYYLILSAQSVRMERVTAQASAAQLEMLRYQLNPHFLFNTLNSISTLVLLRQTDRANVMISRLSSFLRYSLVGEREGTTTLAREVEALKLYLEIERTRFEDRLRTRFTLSPEALEGRLPSLLLQPLVENAVKYAVTPLEEGAEIAIGAEVVGDRLLLSVSDTGPGVPADGFQVGCAGTGVGLANIRDRLAQTYDGDHRFELRENPPHGLTVLIDIPFRTVPALAAAPPALQEAAQ